RARSAAFSSGRPEREAPDSLIGSLRLGFLGALLATFLGTLLGAFLSALLGALCASALRGGSGFALGRGGVEFGCREVHHDGQREDSAQDPIQHAHTPGE